MRMTLPKLCRTASVRVILNVPAKDLASPFAARSFAGTFRMACAGLLAALSFSMVPASALAQTTQPSILEQLDRETRTMYEEVRLSVVRVQMPTPKWMSQIAEQDNPVTKWDEHLDPQVKQRLQEEQTNTARGGRSQVGRAEISATTQPDAGREPATQPSWQVYTMPNGEQAVILEPNPSDEGSVIIITPDGPRDASVEVQPASDFSPNNVGLIIDEAGHILVPLYIEKETIAGAPVKVMGADGTMANARFVGSDRQTNLSVLRLQTPVGKAARLDARRPPEGAVVMLFSPVGSGARLVVWTGGHQDYGLVVASNGNVCGFTRYGQFLGTAACRKVVRQIIEHGSVKRAELGVRVLEVRRDDPRRQDLADFGVRSAMRVMGVDKGSPAEKAGIKTDDLILAIADEPVGDLPTFAALLVAREGDTPILLLRDGQLLTVTVSLHAE